jgi:hypothetical protein
MKTRLCSHGDVPSGRMYYLLNWKFPSTKPFNSVFFSFSHSCQDVEYPDHFSSDMKSLLRGLLQRDVYRRLGCKARGYVFLHSWDDPSRQDDRLDGMDHPGEDGKAAPNK